MTNKRQTEPPTVQPPSAPAAASAPHQISERDRDRIQEAFRMIHAIAARSEEEERRCVTEHSSIVDGDTRA